MNWDKIVKIKPSLKKQEIHFESELGSTILYYQINNLNNDTMVWFDKLNSMYYGIHLLKSIFKEIKKNNGHIKLTNK